VVPCHRGDQLPHLGAESGRPIGPREHHAQQRRQAWRCRRMTRSGRTRTRCRRQSRRSARITTRNSLLESRGRFLVGRVSTAS
jgi:hypothetical protein